MAEMDNLPFDLSNLSREDMDRMMSDYSSDATDISPLFTEGGARAAAQGLTFGTGDEIEAAIRSMMDQGLSFTDALTQVQGEINQFSEENPNIALGAEIAGAIPTMFMAGPRAFQVLSKSPVGATALGGGVGFGYGYATGEGTEGRMQKGIEEGVFTALGSGALGTAIKVAKKTNPYVSPFLRRLKNKVFGGGSVMDDMKVDSIKSLRQYGRADRPQAERDATGALGLFKEPMSSQTDTPLTRKQLDELIYGKFDPMTAAENARLMEMQNPVGDYDVTQ
tara:strand:- start:1577 stop:2413 length:837 start_codon:yes stop_codon:yes gene_type:complete